MMTLFTSGISSFGFSFFKWFFSATGTSCGSWEGFPTFGLKALKWTWNYDFSLTYIGVGACIVSAIWSSHAQQILHDVSGTTVLASWTQQPSTANSFLV
jgi:hypothetical protein